MKTLYLFFIFLHIGCNSDSKSISFSILSRDGKISQISKSVNIDDLRQQKELLEKSEFRKLILAQSNKDNLIIEHEDDDEYLVLVKVRHEQFVIQKKLKTLDEVADIMCQYLIEKDGIMRNTKFY